MNNEKNTQYVSGTSRPQTASNPAGKPASNPFENDQTADRDVQGAAEELDKEQQFKEAQTERD